MAIRAYLALSTHNYVQFFKIVGHIGYFGGAILMRYFTQVRTKALEVLIRSHCQSLKSSYSFPLADMTRMLCFENVATATEFCQYHGLDTTVDLVTLSKTTYMTPESAVPTRRAKFLVEDQLRTTFSEAIAGYHAQQQYFDPPAATSSFDAQAGMLAPEVLKELEERGKVETSNIALSKNIFSEQSLFAQPSQGGSIFGKPANTGGALFQRAIVPTQIQKQQQQLAQHTDAVLKKLMDEALPQLVRNTFFIFLPSFDLLILVFLAFGANFCLFYNKIF
jgi:SAC3/GANP family